MATSTVKSNTKISVIFRGSTTSGTLTLTDSLANYIGIFVGMGTVGSSTSNTAYKVDTSWAFDGSAFRLGMDFVNVLDFRGGLIKMSVDSDGNLTIGENPNSVPIRVIYGVKK